MTFQLLGRPFTIIGHRGAAAIATENTLESLEAARASGVSWVEVDVQLCDDTLILFHDDRLARLAVPNTPDRFIDEMSWEELSAVTLKNNTKIPTLDQALAQFRSDFCFNLELKSRGCVPLLLKCLQHHQIANDRVLISSFFHSELELLRGLHSAIPLAPIIAGDIRDIDSLIKGLNPSAIVNSYSFTTPEFIDRCQELSLPVLAYTVNDQLTADRLKKRGVAGIFSDNPAVFK